MITLCALPELFSFKSSGQFKAFQIHWSLDRALGVFNVPGPIVASQFKYRG